MARIRVSVDDELLTRAKKATGISSAERVVTIALRELIRLRLQRQIHELRGKVHWTGDLAVSRQGRTFPVARGKRG